jgi:hypothetical protein
MLVAPTSVSLLPLRLPYLTTVSKECYCNSLSRRPLPIPISDHLANPLNRDTFPTPAKNRGCMAYDHN